ncbi:hypothetical protein EUTSA_v10022947mg [Eutrema salsugineum]|uniref:Uncharacterized protein n=1 Tax=Eutrema salsugineum TaxID=72664 RepID=V4M4G9_EUTSA|nr:uncharacterized protein LOC18026313 [Eutrema salsugineum]ESQ51114.1 hypothetical protein EUTSA_v10022947mg [Eutrema salsugineum]
MSPSAAMLILSHPLVSHKTTNQSPSLPPVKPSRVFDLLSPWKSSDSEDRAGVGLGWFSGDPGTLEKRFQDALQLSCW